MLFILLRPCGEEMGVTAVLLTARQISRHNMIELIRERGAFDPIYHRETIGMSRTRGRGGWCRHGVCCWVSSGLKKRSALFYNGVRTPIIVLNISAHSVLRGSPQ
jgi:hypothetical protein